MMRTTSVGSARDNICACACHFDGVPQRGKIIGDDLLQYLSTYQAGGRFCSTAETRSEHGQSERHYVSKVGQGSLGVALQFMRTSVCRPRYHLIETTLSEGRGDQQEHCCWRHLYRSTMTSGCGENAARHDHAAWRREAWRLPAPRCSLDGNVRSVGGHPMHRFL